MFGRLCEQFPSTIPSLVFDIAEIDCICGRNFKSYQQGSPTSPPWYCATLASTRRAASGLGIVCTILALSCWLVLRLCNGFTMWALGDESGTGKWDICSSHWVGGYFHYAALCSQCASMPVSESLFSLGSHDAFRIMVLDSWYISFKAGIVQQWFPLVSRHVDTFGFKLWRMPGILNPGSLLQEGVAEGDWRPGWKNWPSWYDDWEATLMMGCESMQITVTKKKSIFKYLFE